MIGKNLGYFGREARLSLSRNRLLSFATVITVAICIFILGVAVLMTINATYFMDQLESDLEIIVYVDKDSGKADTAQLEKDIKEIKGVGTVAFVSRNQAMERLQKKFQSKDYNLSKTVGKNPLPDSFEVKASDPQQVVAVAGRIAKLPGVSKVNYGQSIVEKLFKVTHGVRIVSVALIILLALGAVFLIATTIRLAIFARRKEIYLMKLIGATDWFVRWPFFMEGIVLGAVGSLMAVLLLALGYSSLLSNLGTASFFISLVHEKNLLLNIYGSLVITGAVLGVLGTWISVNRFLDV